MKGCIFAIPKAKIARKLSKAFLETDLEGHHLEIANDFTIVLDILESTLQNFDVLVFLFICPEKAKEIEGHLFVFS